MPVDLTASKQVSKHPKLDSALANVAVGANLSTTEALSRAGAESLRVSDSQVHVQIITHPSGLENVLQALTEAGGTVTGVSNETSLIQGWLPVSALETVAAQSDVYYIRRPVEAVLLENLKVGSSTTEALDDINATAWHAAGYTGTGVKVGIVDGGFIGYTGLLSTDLPASVTVRNFVDGETDAQVGTTTEHGTACAEVVHDMAPGAQLYLVKIATNLDLQEAVTYLIGQGVDIISTSLGWYNLTPGDGTGEFTNLVTQARNNGILWTTAASNDREAHWGGLYNDPDSDDYHNFNGTQEVNYFGSGDGSAYSIPSGYIIRVFLRWNDWTSVNQDYDLYLLRWNGSNWATIASSTNNQNGGVGQSPTEYVIGITTGSSAPYGFVVERWSSTWNVNFEIFAPKVARLDELLYARSLSNLADAPNAMTVAALDVTSPYPQESYSSEGPTNGPGGAETGGSIKPDISGYANVSTESYGAGGFDGTSAATPHVAGAAALVLDANPTYTPAQLQSFLEDHAIDMGSPDKDTIFGYGRLYLDVPSSGPETNYLYLPLILKSPSMTAAQPGFWSDPGKNDFYVTTDSANVAQFKTYFSVSGCGSYSIYRTVLDPITNNHFSFTGSYYASGMFNSSKTASGTCGLSNFSIPGCGVVSGGPWSWSATWQTSTQPTFFPATLVEPEVVEPATESGYPVTIVTPVK
ncbi:MAG: S8 family serine peptidase [Anaerolineae bacterium]|nr:S8 family serine peptidase [Anaerolineae bacterium]